MKKFIIKGAIAEVIGLALFNALVWIIPFVRNDTFWISYGFAMFAILMQVPMMAYAFHAGKDAKSRLYGFPLARLAFIYLVVQVLVSWLILAFAQWIPAWIVTVFYVLFLGFMALGFVAADSMRAEINVQDQKLQQSVSKIRTLQSIGASLSSQTKDAVLKKELDAYAEQLRFSDPVSSESLADVEKELGILTDELSQSLINDDVIGAMQLCKKAESVLAERNRLCKLNK